MTFVGTKLRYQQAIDALKKDIECGKYLPGQKLPPIRAISDSLGMNYLTVRKAMKHLAEDGIIRIQHGAGTFVADLPKKAEKKTINIVLACRKYMLDVTQHHPAIGTYIAGAHRRCPSPEYMIQPMFYSEYEFVRDIGNTLVSQQIDGVIITGGGLKKRDYEFLRANNIPTAIIGVFEAEFDDWVLSVDIDFEMILRQAVEHLRNLGHKRIGYISYKYTSTTGGATHRTFADIIFDNQLGNPKELMILVSNPDGHPHWEDVEDFFEIVPLPSGVIVSDEFIADILLASCERRGIKIPDDLSIVIQHDLLPFSHRIPLTGANGVEHTSEMIYQACDMLVREIKGESVLKRHVTLTPRLIVKASTGPVKEN